MICRALGLFYSLRYWLRGGVLAFSIDGHEYGEPRYEVRANATLRSLTGDVPPRVEWEWATCERCGHVDGAWRPLWSAA